MSKLPKSTTERDADLVKALEWLARAAIGSGIDAQTFLRSARRALALAGRASVSPRNSVKKVSVSQLSAITGLNRKELPELLDPSNENAKRSSPAWTVVQYWTEAEEYSTGNGTPNILPIDSGIYSFKTLVKALFPDVPHMSLLKELERQGLVERRSRKAVALKAKAVSSMKKRLAAFTRISTKTRIFSSSVYKSEYETEAAGLNELLVLQGIPEKVVGLFFKSFSERSKSLLAAAEKWRAANVSEDDSSGSSETLALGIYLVREPNDQDVKKEGVRASRKPNRRAKRA